MRAVQVTAWGGPEVLKEVDIPEPTPSADKVRVKVKATVVNPVDIGTAAGMFSERLPDTKPPFILGWDFAGIVIEDANSFVSGQHVIGLIPWLDEGNGTEAEIIAVDPSWIAPLPDSVSFADAASVALNGLAAWQALDNLALSTGATVVITGSSGGVGGFAVQEAIARGFNVIAISSEGDTEYVRSLGAQTVIERTDEIDLVAAVRKVATNSVDAVFDGAGAAKNLIAVIRDGGTFNTINGVNLPNPERNIDVIFTGTVPNVTQLERAGALLAKNKLVTRIAQELPLSEVAEAHRRIAKGEVTGKLVLNL